MTKAKIIKCSFLALLLLPEVSFAEASQSGLKGKITHIIDTAGGKIGVGVQGADFKAGFVINGESNYPMMSVFKFPLALAILHLVDKGKLNLGQKISIPRDKLDTNTWSPLVKDFPTRDPYLSLSDLLTYAVTKGDNNACDFLYGLAGGTAAVNTYLHRLGVKDISIVYTEEEMGKTRSLQYDNWSKPTAMLQLLQLFYHQKLLSKQSNDFLFRIMTELPGESKRITAFLPPNTKLVHAMGSSGIAINDVGILTLPNGKHLVIVIFVADYKGPREISEHTIATISKQIWDFYTRK